MKFNDILTPKHIDCEKEWIYCDKFSSFFKILILAASINLIFVFVRYFEGNYTMVVSNLIGLVTFTSIMFILHWQNSLYHFFSRLFILVTFSLAIMSMSLTDQGTRAIWLGTIAVAAFYFRDQKEGLFWTVFFIVVTLLSEYFYFDNQQIFRVVDTATLIANFILIAAMLSWYERVKVKDQQKLKEQNVRLEQMVQDRTAELEQLTKTDELTGLYNRRMLFEVEKRVLPTLARDKKSFIFVMADVDHFKQYNDTYGHIQGDQTLKKIADAFRKHFSRGSDFVFRVGGEEFGIIFTGLGKEEAFDHVEMLRQEIFDLDIEHEHNPPFHRITVSFGIEHLIPDKESDFRQIYTQADRKLYEAKESGRNRIVI